MIKRILMVLMVPSLSALVLWTGGFNFDQRNPLLAYGVIVCLSAMALVWNITGDD